MSASGSLTCRYCVLMATKSLLLRVIVTLLLISLRGEHVALWIFLLLLFLLFFFEAGSCHIAHQPQTGLPPKCPALPLLKEAGEHRFL